MEALEAADASLAGIMANHSIIHTPPELLPGTLAEFRRTLRPGGLLLLGFPSCDDGPAEPYDHMTYPAYRHSADRVAGVLLGLGLAELARLVVAPGEDPKRGFAQAYLLARRNQD